MEHTVNTIPSDEDQTTRAVKPVYKSLKLSTISNQLEYGSGTHVIKASKPQPKTQSKATAVNRPLSELEYRDIARMFVKALPLDGDDYKDTIEAYIEIIRKLPNESKIALRCAYIFSSKVQYEEREDFFQDLALTLLKAKNSDEKLAYSIARCDWIDYWKRQHAHETRFCVYRSYQGQANPDCSKCPNKDRVKDGKCAWLAYRGIRSLDSEISDDDGSNTTLSELIVGEADYEARLIEQMDVTEVLNKLETYPAIKALINKDIGL
jgi:hypothetical protein